MNTLESNHHRSLIGWQEVKQKYLESVLHVVFLSNVATDMTEKETFCDKVVMYTSLKECPEFADSKSKSFSLLS